MPLGFRDNFDNLDVFTHRFADQGCNDTFEVLCRRNLEDVTGIPTSAPIRLDNGQGAPAGNGGIDGNEKKKFSIEMVGAVAALLAFGLLIAFFFLRNETLEVGKSREREVMLGALADSEEGQSEEGNATEQQQPKPFGGENQPSPPGDSRTSVVPVDPVLEIDLEV